MTLWYWRELWWKCWDCGWDLIGILWGLHDTDIFMYHRAMITVDRPIDSYLYWWSFSDWLDRGSYIDLLREVTYGCLALKSPTAPTVVWHWRVQPFPFCNRKQNWGSLSGDCQRGKLSPHSREGTVSNHIVKIRCLYKCPVWWHNASIGECESCGGSLIWLEIGEMIFSKCGID